MIEYFDCSIVDPSQKRIISGSVKNRIKDYEVQLDQFRKEIEWWFDLYKKTSVRRSFNIKKPIVIEMYEFSGYLTGVMKQINDAVHIIKKKYKSKNRDYPIVQIEKTQKKKILQCKKYLRPFRNQIAAHRYTTKGNKFLKRGDLFALHTKLSIKNLFKCKIDLFQSHDMVISWLLNPINRNNLIIGDKY